MNGLTQDFHHPAVAAGLAAVAADLAAAAVAAAVAALAAAADPATTGYRAVCGPGCGLL